MVSYGLRSTLGKVRSCIFRRNDGEWILNPSNTWREVRMQISSTAQAGENAHRCGCEGRK